MRILFVHTIGRKKYGGGERWAVNAAAGLQEQGHYVVLAGSKNSVLLNEAQNRGVVTENFTVYNDINPYKTWRLARLIRKHKIDVVICKGRELVVSGLAAKFSGNPLLIRRSGSPPPAKSLRLVLRTKWFVDGVITNTETIREIYANNGIAPEGFVKVIYNGLIPDDTIAPFDFSSQYPGKTIVLSVGRVVGHKGYFFLIDALPGIREHYPDMLFYILGDGRDMDKLVAYAQEKGVEDMIHFAGYVHEPIPYVKGCNLFLHPSLYEGMPNAPMEAMAYGKPVIMTRVNGAAELSQDGKYATLIPPANSNAIAEAILEARKKKEEWDIRSNEAMQFVRENFGMLKMVKSLESFIYKRMEAKNKQQQK